MNDVRQIRQYDADEAIAIFEDSVSYYMPEDLIEEATASDDSLVAYSEAA
ncbi:hypothetical protein [Poseidonocella sp. HB161398]|nr:hypothetical protein [Poseidonocella sp. HB161398]